MKTLTVAVNALSYPFLVLLVVLCKFTGWHDLENNVIDAMHFRILAFCIFQRKDRPTRAGIQSPSETSGLPADPMNKDPQGEISPSETSGLPADPMNKDPQGEISPSDTLGEDKEPKVIPEPISIIPPISVEIPVEIEKPEAIPEPTLIRPPISVGMHKNMICVDRKKVERFVSEVIACCDLEEIQAVVVKARDEEDPVVALQLLRMPKVLDILKLRNVLNNDEEISQLIVCALGNGNCDTNETSDAAEAKTRLTLNVDAVVADVARSRCRVITKEPRAGETIMAPCPLYEMLIVYFVQCMGKAEEWYFGGKKGEFPEELAGIKPFVVEWFEKHAEQNFDEYSKQQKVKCDYQHHFRSLKNVKIGNVLSACKYCVYNPFLMLAELHERQQREHFTNISIVVHDLLFQQGDSGKQIAAEYMSQERQPWEPYIGFHVPGSFCLHTFWIQHLTTKSLDWIFSPRRGETQKQTAERALNFLCQSPQPSNAACHSTNFSEALFVAHGQDLAVDDEGEVIKRSSMFHGNGLKLLWAEIDRILGSLDEQDARDWQRRLLDPFTKLSFWECAGPLAGGRHVPPTIVKEDYEELKSRMLAIGLALPVEFSEVSTFPRKTDLSAVATTLTDNQAVCYGFSEYGRMQPQLKHGD